MNIQYDENLGQSKVANTFSPTDDSVYYRTLNFDCQDLCGNHIDELTRFLDDKIDLSHVAVSSKAIILVGHNADFEPNRQAVDHVMTLIGSRILTCESLRWGFVTRTDCVGHRFIIYLPTTNRSVTAQELLVAMQHNSKPSVERTEIKPTHLCDRILVWFGVRKRRYNVNINGSHYEV